MSEPKIEKVIQDVILQYYPSTQGIYLFGSYHTDREWKESDVDIALLLPHITAKQEGSLYLSECSIRLETILKKDMDLINLRMVSTVLQFQVITSGRLIYTYDNNAIDEFEMLTCSYYQKLNEERQEILEDFFITGKAYRV
jgi:uncharacterized protein